jgi:hypothetical protein
VWVFGHVIQNDGGFLVTLFKTMVGFWSRYSPLPQKSPEIWWVFGHVIQFQKTMVGFKSRYSAKMLGFWSRYCPRTTPFFFRNSLQFSILQSWHDSCDISIIYPLIQIPPGSSNRPKIPPPLKVARFAR